MIIFLIIPMIAASIALTSVNLHLWRAGGGTNFFFVSLLGAISLLIGISSYFSKIAPIYPILLNILVGGITFRVSKSGRLGSILLPGIWPSCTSYHRLSQHCARFGDARHTGCLYPSHRELTDPSP